MESYILNLRYVAVFSVFVLLGYLSQCIANPVQTKTASFVFVFPRAGIKAWNVVKSLTYREKQPEKYVTSGLLVSPG